MGKIRMQDSTLQDALKRFIEKGRRDPDLLAIFLFGSRVRGDEGPNSDVDICLVLQPRRYTELELSQKKLEYLKDFDFDVQIYQQLPLYIRRRVLKEGKVLFCQDEDQLYQLAFRTAQQFEDFRHIYYTYLQEVARG
ncbi:MAG: nucleotidyltransferase domain-containing protein [Thermoproteota archaeon]|nr:MAG: nucleotidyltransferase domain-containing protein [Candidatus Korarchaeota archaeon]